MHNMRNFMKIMGKSVEILSNVFYHSKEYKKI